MIILVVDSRRDALAQTAAALREACPEARVFPFEDGMEAVQYSLNHPVDAVYTEVLMPHLTGFDVARLVRKFRPDAVACIVSGTDAFLEQARGRGMGGYYLKPLTMGEPNGNLLGGPKDRQCVV